MLVSLDAEDCLAIINGPSWCSRQFGSIRNWNALGLIRKTKPKYPLLVMRMLCHSLTPLPFWLCSKRAQGKHLHFCFFFFFDGRNSFFWWGGENERENESAVNCQLHWEWWLCETIVYEKRIWGHLMRIYSTLNASCFPEECIAFFSGCNHAWIPTTNTWNYILDMSLY